MALPTGTFTSPFAGTLVVRLTSVFYANQYRDAGFPSSGGSAGGTNVAVRAYAGPSGSPTYGGIVDKYNLMNEFELAYPGGNAAWPVGVQEVAHQTDMSLYRYGMDPVTLTCRLVKK